MVTPPALPAAAQTYALPPALIRPGGARTAAVQPLSSYATVHDAVSRQEWQAKILDWVVEGPGVLGFALNLKATIAGLGTWYIGQPDGRGGWKRVESEREQAIAMQFQGVGGEPREELFRQQIFTNESIGEFLLAAHRTDKGARFEMVQMNQVVSDHGMGQYVAVQDSPLTQHQREKQKEGGYQDHLRYIPKDQVVRTWCRNPWWPKLAHSPMQRAIPDIERLISHQRRIKRLSDSRLVNNEIIWLAAEAAMQYANIQDGQKADFHRDFRLMAQRTFTGHGGVGEVAPFTLSTPYEYGPPQKISAGDPIDEFDLMAEESGLKAVGRAVDLPMRVFFESETGGNHWSDWLLESQFIRTSAEPTAQKALDALTIAWLRPMYNFLKGVGWIDPSIDPSERRLLIDMSGILKNPDESKVLLSAWREGIATRETVARRGLNLSTDEIMELPDEFTDFEAWKILVQGEDRGAAERDPVGADQLSQGTLPDTEKEPRLAAAFQNAEHNDIPPQLLALALKAATTEPTPVPEIVAKAEQIVRGAFLDHKAYSADDDLLELLA